MTKPLHLCFVADSSSIHVRRWLHYFVARGHQVTCLSDKPDTIDGVRHISLPTWETAPKRQKESYRELRELLKEQRISLDQESEQAFREKIQKKAARLNKEHRRMLREKLQEKGIRLNKANCQFLWESYKQKRMTMERERYRALRFALNQKGIEVELENRFIKSVVIEARAHIIADVVNQLQPDILHAHFIYYRGWASALARFHPLVITLYGSDIYMPKGPADRPWEIHYAHQLNTAAMLQADLVTAVSADLYNVARRKTFGQVPVELIPIGTDRELFHPNPPEAHLARLREQLNIPNGAFVVFSPRQMTPLYNIEVLIDSIPHVLQQVPHAVFLLKDAFRNTPEREAYVASLRQRVEDLGISQAVRWVEQVPYEDLPVLYNLADVIVSIPSTDGMPVTLFEAMACETPVIVGDLPSYTRIVAHEKTGLRVPLGNVAALGEAICRIATDPALSKRLMENAREVVNRYGIFDEQMARMEAAYYKLVERKAHRKNRLRKALAHQWMKRLIRRNPDPVFEFTPPKEDEPSVLVP